LIQDSNHSSSNTSQPFKVNHLAQTHKHACATSQS
jgi:hypothetical protein